MAPLGCRLHILEEILEEFHPHQSSKVRSIVQTNRPYIRYLFLQLLQWKTSVPLLILPEAPL